MSAFGSSSGSSSRRTTTSSGGSTTSTSSTGLTTMAALRKRVTALERELQESNQRLHSTSTSTTQGLRRQASERSRADQSAIAARKSALDEGTARRAAEARCEQLERRLALAGVSSTGGAPPANADDALAQTERRLGEAEAQIAALQSSLAEAREAAVSSSKQGSKKKHTIGQMVTVEENVGGKAPTLQRGRLQRNCSVLTSQALDKMVKPTSKDAARDRVLGMFANPVAASAYLASTQFLDDSTSLCTQLLTVFEAEPRVVAIESPCYVFGDLHGNLEDLHFFADNIWKLGLERTAGHFLFLGDYVDRGMNSLEVMSYLLALKLLDPDKICLLRGNHETRDMNGWEDHFAEKSFVAQCKSRFGDEAGYELWELFNTVFDRLPLAAVIDQDIFCVHGGIPRPMPGAPSGQSRLDQIRGIPAASGIGPPNATETEDGTQMAFECLWSDPADERLEDYLDVDTGYGDSPRGGGTIAFGYKAIDDFLAENDLSFIIRAHEAHADGVSLAKAAKLFTVFSTSKDHHQGKSAVAGCILVDYDKIQVVIRSPKYKNRFVHRKTSMAIRDLPEAELEARRGVGLVRAEYSDGDDDSEDGSEADDMFER